MGGNRNRWKCVWKGLESKAERKVERNCGSSEKKKELEGKGKYTEKPRAFLCFFFITEPKHTETAAEKYHALVMLSGATRKGQQQWSPAVQQDTFIRHSTARGRTDREWHIYIERGLCYNQRRNALLREDDTSQTAGQSSKRNKHGEETLSLREDW